MKIATWNVNSLKVRLNQVLQWLEEYQPEILALQETKSTDDNFPLAAINAAGYQVVYSGQKTYNGVAILSKTTATNTIVDLPELVDPQRRILAANIDGIRVLNVYVPNGSSVGSEKYHYKLTWLGHLADYVKQQLKQHEKFVILGDFNIAPTDQDVHDPALWKDTILCSEPERRALQKLLSYGLIDLYRQFNHSTEYSWWDYRQAAFRRNLGLRIDLILVNDALAVTAKQVLIDRLARTAERPSDHAPVLAEFW